MLTSAIGTSPEMELNNKITHSEIRMTEEGYRIFLNGEPFYVQGAGVDRGSLESLASHGANAFRTWSTENAEAVLDQAQELDLKVMMGIWVGLERHGFDYNDKAAVKAQLDRIRKRVEALKDHPALIVWGIGNEMNLQSRNPKVWNAVNEISEMIHEVDPNHLTTTQYIKFLSDDFSVRKVEFKEENLQGNKEVRVLFKHLVSLGYINIKDCDECQRYLDQPETKASNPGIIDISSRQWYCENPFKASKDEYHLIFDVKEVVDEEFRNHITQQEVVELVNANGYSPGELVKSKVGLSIKNMLLTRLLVESKKEIAFTAKNIQEVSHDMGYSEPSYFNRFFKKQTGQSPGEFRELFGTLQGDLFVQDLLHLLKTYHQVNHELAFYADKMHMSVKGLSKKVRAKMNAPLGHLIRQELIQSAQKMLDSSETVVEISRKLHFEEPNHFSRFFKKYTGMTPSEYQKSSLSL